MCIRRLKPSINLGRRQRARNSFDSTLEIASLHEQTTGRSYNKAHLHTVIEAVCKCAI